MYKNIPRLYYNKINVNENNELYFILIDFFYFNDSIQGWKGI